VFGLCATAETFRLSSVVRMEIELGVISTSTSKLLLLLLKTLLSRAQQWHTGKDLGTSPKNCGSIHGSLASPRLVFSCGGGDIVALAAAARSARSSRRVIVIGGKCHFLLSVCFDRPWSYSYLSCSNSASSSGTVRAVRRMRPLA